MMKRYTKADCLDLELAKHNLVETCQHIVNIGKLFAVNLHVDTLIEIISDKVVYFS